MSDESIEETNQEMYSRDKSLDINESESTTPSVNPVSNQPPNTRRDNTEIFRMIAEALQRAVGSMPATTSTPATRQAPIKELKKYGATEFLGLKGTDSTTAENWLETTKRILKQLECTTQESLVCVVSLLQEEAYIWWESVIQNVPEEQVNWEFFQREFQKKYLGETYMEDQKQECKRFLRGLRDEFQLQLMPLWITEFVNLIERAKMIEQVLGKSKKSETACSIRKRPGTASSSLQVKRSRESWDSRRFSSRSERGDRNRKRQTSVSTGSIRSPAQNIEIPECEYCGNKHREECRKLTGGCFRCGSTDHFVKDYPKIGKVTPTKSQRSESASRGRGSGQSGLAAR
ncbi:uncharacterized protein LOC108484899 [Gossypium arboreum]|uniref:uncharacterized protein LOC108484899 n=1 Tax=Gossypium arboreum TaxID=29729 RepID=UPI0008190CE5|nr:uncharacterized protein LOC108484899 [Gossypium arboreum]